MNVLACIACSNLCRWIVNYQIEACEVYRHACTCTCRCRCTLLVSLTCTLQRDTVLPPSTPPLSLSLSLSLSPSPPLSLPLPPLSLFLSLSLSFSLSLSPSLPPTLSRGRHGCPNRTRSVRTVRCVAGRCTPWRD